MITFRALNWATTFLLAISITARLSAKQTSDHLLPTDTKFASKSYYKLWNQKLLVTPGGMARMVWLPGNFGEETAVSLYRDTKKQGGLSGGYWITFTQASTSLWSSVSPDKPNIVDPASVVVNRFDVPISKKTALAIEKIWRRMLQGVKPDPGSNSIFLDSTTEIFTADGASGVLSGELPKEIKGPRTKALSAIAGSLMEYGTMPASLRPRKDRQIGVAATNLLATLRE